MKYLRREIETAINRDLKKKMVFLAGPRQCGKTSTAKHILKQSSGKLNRYLNWDSSDNREDILKENFPAGSGLIVLDEIHKYSRWRQVVKGLYDSRSNEISVLVTGSGKLEHYSHGGDSLQGRYFLHRMYPLALEEFSSSQNY
ncbi:MAG: AAA family ATPase, partial [Deltaproteobacteria bacterium]|nr:AAA family ATPase [Deltaproteobacteria bacterium]